MRDGKRKRGQRIRIVPDKRDLARSALAFGRSGGCASSTCTGCRFYWLCEGGEINTDAEIDGVETTKEERQV